MQGEAFSELPYLPEDKSSKRNLLVKNPSQGISWTREDGLLSQEGRQEIDTISKQALS